MPRTRCTLRHVGLMPLFFFLPILAPLQLAYGAFAQSATAAKAGSTPRPSSAERPTAGEERAIRTFNRAKANEASAVAIEAFLAEMPKGGDLHTHLSGAVYAETFLKDAAADQLCVDPVALAFVKDSPAAPASRLHCILRSSVLLMALVPVVILLILAVRRPFTWSTPSRRFGLAGLLLAVLVYWGLLLRYSCLKNSVDRPGCPQGSLPAAATFAGDAKSQKLYEALVDSFSMRDFVPSAGVSGHDQFFGTFDRFGGIDKSHTGEWLDEVATRAAAQNEQYLEVMLTPSFFELKPLWDKLGWPATPARATIEPEGDATGTSRPELDALRTKLLAGGLENEVNLDVKEMDDALEWRDSIEHCKSPNAAAACNVDIRFVYQILRQNLPQQVFAQTLLGFEVVSAESSRDHPAAVGINLVQPEDAYLSMSEYNRQMHMLDYLHGVYPKVHISLHAGELAPGLVPPEGLKFHIREAVVLGHAERIGHGVDVMYETDPGELLKEMADRHVMVEINLTSNDAILGIVPPRHPLPEYLDEHVPVALSTDDEGVSRIDLTHEYVRAAMEYELGYLDLKKMAQTSLEHSFLPGESLWEKPDVFTRMRAACAGQTPNAAVPAAGCMALRRSSQKADAQWELERRFEVFEASLP